MDEAEAAVTRILLDRLEDDTDAFSIESQSNIMQTLQEVNKTMSIMLGGIAAVSLLVGGIGIMNIMLVSVTERTREIGIRKAIGASKGMILLQFLVEACIVSMMGCAVGIVLSDVILRVLSIFFGESMQFKMNIQVVWISVLFSGMIGIVFGLYPANKAAKKKPIDALRYSG
jgi:putative ABC transport system permease protein